jgi:hypothetical protein
MLRPALYNCVKRWGYRTRAVAANADMLTIDILDSSQEGLWRGRLSFKPAW